MPARVIARTAAKANGPGGWICQSCLHRGLQVAARPFHRASRSSRVKPVRQPATSRSSTSPRPVLQRRSFAATPPLEAAPKRQPVLPNKPARTRFAPSPTGYLHIGGLRTALFSYLLAKRTGGQFLLRIEDTDQKRLVPGAEQRLIEDLRWAGLQWDEGPQVEGSHGPYRQSERTGIYQQHAHGLLDSGAAYRCFCTPQTAGQGIAAYVTSGCYQNCSSLSPAEAQERVGDQKTAFTVRLKRPEDAKKRIYPDLIYGKITPLKRSPTAPASAEADSGIDAADTILIKSDGTPTYHFANVVDDHLMKITHVIRGTEWMASTPLHYDLYHAFGWDPPAFAHVGLLVDEQKAKLSKRNADLALDVQSMKDEHGVPPETLVNFLALLGWSNPTDNDVMDMQQLIHNFDLKFTKGNTMVRMEKLWFLQKHHVAQRCSNARAMHSNEPVRDLVSGICDEVKRRCSDIDSRFQESQLQQYCSDILLADSKSYQNAWEYVERNCYFFAFDLQQVPEPKEFYDKEISISADNVQGLLKAMLQDFDFKQPYREAFTVGAREQEYVPSPDEDSKLWFEQTSARIHAAISHQIWDCVLNYESGSPQSAIESGSHEYFTLEPNELPFTDRPFDEAAFVGSFSSAAGVKGGPEALHEVADADEPTPDVGPAVDAAVKRKKAWSTAIMRYLREKLSYGMPGPSIGVVMAILGYEECCRRLGVEAREGGGW